jgi:hypothetical protein
MKNLVTSWGPFGEGGVSRRSFMRGTAGAAGAGVVLGTGALASRPAGGDDDDDRGRVEGICGDPFPIPHLSPIPFSVGAIHVFGPGPVDADPAAGHDPSLITDFKGVIGECDLNLTGMGTDATGASGRYDFHCDMRFMRGSFVAVDGRKHRGAFAFI